MNAWRGEDDFTVLEFGYRRYDGIVPMICRHALSADIECTGLLGKREVSMLPCWTVLKADRSTVRIEKLKQRQDNLISMRAGLHVRQEHAYSHLQGSSTCIQTSCHDSGNRYAMQNRCLSFKMCRFCMEFQRKLN